MQQQIDLPKSALDHIKKIVQEQEIFEDEEDFILHAVVDLLEKYKDI